jgi:hypothetical protein
MTLTSELPGVVFPSPNSNQLLFRYTVGPHHIFGALRANDCGASLKCNVRHIQYVIEVRMSYEDEVCPLNMRVIAAMSGVAMSVHL